MLPLQPTESRYRLRMVRQSLPAARGFSRDFGIAALIAIPLIAAAAGGYVYWQAASLVPDAPEPVTVALSAPSEAGEAEAAAAATAAVSAAPRARAAAPALETVVPFFEID